MIILTWFAYVPAALIGLILAAAAIWCVFLGARGLARWVRYRAARRFRKVRVPADGAKLTHGEAQAFVTILRGWKRSAPEPAYDERRSQWDS